MREDKEAGNESPARVTCKIVLSPQLWGSMWGLYTKQK